jgi:hypothetical protein
MVTTHVKYASPTNKRLGLRRTAVELISTQMAYMPTAGPGLDDTLAGQRSQIAPK